MATPSVELIQALRITAARLKTDVEYRWSHHGSCNCGHLAQTLTHLSKEEIHRLSLEKRGDWDQHTQDYCPTSGYPIDYIISQMLEMGLATHDLAHLERLSDPNIRSRMPMEIRRELSYKKREDVIYYMEVWAAMLEEQLQPEIHENKHIWHTKERLLT